MATIGATWPDLGIRLVDFAASEPWKFMLTIPLSVALTAFLILVLRRVFFTGPLGKQMAEFQEAIAKTGGKANDKPTG